MKTIGVILMGFIFHFYGMASLQDFSTIATVDVYYDQGRWEDTLSYKGASTVLSVYANENISFNYDFSYAKRSDQFRSVHTPVGAVAGPPIFAFGLISTLSCLATEKDSSSNVNSGTNNPDSTENCRFCTFGKMGLVLGALITILPDGLSFHWRPTDWMTFSPYVNFIGMDFTKNKINGETDLVYAASLGSAITFSFGNFRISGRYELRTQRHYGWGQGLSVGMGIGF